MAELKTKPLDADPAEFLASVEDERKRQDCQTLLRWMRDITGEEPKMWGPSIVGFGSYHYKYKSGREGDWFKAGFAPRKRDLTIYIVAGFAAYEDLLAKLGKHKTGVSCLYLKKLDDVDHETLRELISRSVEDISNRY